MVYIFGAGKNGIKLLKYLKSINNLLQMGVEISAFIDNDISKQGVEIEGIECICLNEAIRRGAQNHIVLISPYKCDEIKKQLEIRGFHKVINVGEILNSRIKNFVSEYFAKTNYKYLVPFADYESPYPDIVEIEKREDELFDREKDVLGIDLNLGSQLELVNKMKSLESPVWYSKNIGGGVRYYYDNPWYLRVDANVLSYLIAIIKPKRIVEVGSGFSTAAMLDVNEKNFNNKIQIVSIEPNAERLKSLLKETDNITIYEKNLQTVPLSFFETLKENDLLFIDSSHISKFNSDVNYLFFEILPRLHHGVYIHFHDIQYPFIYPKEWIYEGRAYTEMYLLRAFLINNKEYSVYFWCDMLQEKAKSCLIDPLLGSATSSIYIRKTDVT